MVGLHVDSILKRYGEKQLLTDVYLSCHVGEVVALLGRNGSGKSTLLEIIFGSLHTDNKFIRADAKQIYGLWDRRNLINYLPQDSFLPDRLMVQDIISLFCDAKNKASISELDEIKNLLDKKIAHLSGGEKRLLEVYLIIYSKAKYILLDEPFNGIAPLYKEKIKEQIIQHTTYKGFIITDHDYRNVLDIATKTILIYDGGTREIKNKEELNTWGYLPDSAV